MRLRPCYAILLIVLSSPATVRSDEAKPSLRVFYTGHSFHMFVPARVAQMVKAAAIKEYEFAGSQGIGGSRVDQHWNLADEKNKAKKALATGNVDVFTMAAHLMIPDEGIDRFVELGLKHNPKMRFLVQASWWPFDAVDGKRVTTNEQRDETDLEKLRASQELWTSKIEAQARALNQKVGREAVYIVPAGEAVLKLRTLIRSGKAPGITKQSELFRDPIGHGNPPLLLLVSYCNFACITGRSPIGLNINEPGVSGELQTVLQQIAWDTVSSYPMSGVKAGK